MLVSLAWKNIWRSKIRSFILIGAITTGLFGGLLASSINFGMGEQMIQSAIGTQLSHIQIHNPLFRQNKSLKDTLREFAELERKMKSTSGVARICKRLVISAMVSSPGNAAGVNLVGIVPSEEQRITDVHTRMVHGTYFEGKIRNPAIIGQDLAKKLNLKVGSKLVGVFQDDSGAMSGCAFRIVGVFKTVSTNFDKGMVFVLAKDLHKLMDGRMVWNEIAFLHQQDMKTENIAAILKANNPGVQIETWKELAPELAYIADSLTTMLYIFMVVILLALAFGIVNTMLMVVLERKRELGMLMAVGMRPRKIVLMVILESSMLSLCGVCFGMVFTFSTIQVLQKTGIDLSLFSQGLNAYGIDKILYPSLPWSMYPILTGMVVATASLAAVYPAYRVLKQKPSEALRAM